MAALKDMEKRLECPCGRQFVGRNADDAERMPKTSRATARWAADGDVLQRRLAHANVLLKTADELDSGGV
jgi:hypothetical protein